MLIESIQLSKQCELTFKTDETTRTVTAQTGIACPEVISVPSKEGYVFAGWWNGEKQFDPSATVYGSAEYLAKFVRLTTETVDGLYKSNARKKYNFLTKLHWSDLFVELCWNTTEKAMNAYTNVLLLLNRN